MAAEATAIHLLKAGDHVISGDDVYGGTYRLFQDVMTNFGLEFTFLRMDSRERIEQAIKPNTRMLWLETPSNPILNTVDPEMVDDIDPMHNLLTVLRNILYTRCLLTRLTSVIYLLVFLRHERLVEIYPIAYSINLEQIVHN